MSNDLKQNRLEQLQNEVSEKILKVGNFYLIHDGSKTGHPGFIIWKNDKQNRYLVIRTNSDKKGKISKEQMGEKHITKLKHPTDNNVLCSYVHNRPMICRRKDIGSKVLIGMAFHHDDLSLINEISKRKPEVASSFRKNKK